MKQAVVLTCAVLALSAAINRGSLLADDANEDLVETIISLVGNNDKDLRALGLEQVREAAKGEAATRRFAALLPKLPPDGQAALLAALGTRGDKAARPSVLDMLKSPEEPVRLAAIRSLGPLGETADVPLLAQLLAAASAPQKAAARASLVQLTGAPVGPVIVGELKRAKPDTRAELIGVLAARRALDCVDGILPAALDADAGVRQAAMAALGQLATPEQIPGMVRGVLLAEAGAEREAAERAVALVCNRISDPAKRAAPLMAAFMALEEASDVGYNEAQIALLPTLGRVGGRDVRWHVDSALVALGKAHEAGIHALCNWPDGSVGPKLLDLAQSAASPADRLTALRGLIRVAPLRDKRSDAERLDMLQKAMGLATRDEERNLVLRKCQAVRTIESLRFVAPYMEQPALAQQAAATVVELAHHRELRGPNKAEFDRALDSVIRTSRDADVLDRAQRYKKGQTRELRIKEER
ncbi:MAG: HEAT repeat domain-containing protein [Thermoguttaceae bacterium]